jgi:NAD(P)-dependent dehydrogenase (short-subunit alcohol dehydrogenase family)
MAQPQKIAIITGGSRGLGRAMAIHLARAGIDSVITYNSREDAATEVVAEVGKAGAKAKAIRLDTAATACFPAFVEQVRAALKAEWGREDFDSLVNNAGTGVHSLFAGTREEEFDALMNIHFKGVFFLTQALLPLIVDGGRIVNISSGLTRISLPGYAAYAAMKGAIEVLTRYQAKELGSRGIAVNTIAPGAIETDFGGGAVRDNAELNRMIASLTAMGRVGQPDDIGGAVASLLAGENGWITGQRIEVSGGQAL